MVVIFWAVSGLVAILGAVFWMIGTVLVLVSWMVGGRSVASAALVAVFPSDMEFSGGRGWLSFVHLLSIEKYEKHFYNIFMLVVKYGKMKYFTFANILLEKKRVRISFPPTPQSIQFPQNLPTLQLVGWVNRCVPAIGELQKLEILHFLGS